jgi:Pentapeptide repeats (8 copies)
MVGRVRPRRGLLALAAAAGLAAAGWLATTPWLVEHWPRLLAFGLFGLVLAVPRWFVPARGRDGEDRQHADDVGVGLLRAVAAVAVLAAAVVTFQQLDTDRRLLRQQLAVAGQEQATERFARALDQLGSEQLDVRLGGIYGLERIAARGAELAPDGEAGSGGTRGAEPPEFVAWWPSQDRVQVFEVLSAYVRTTSRRPPLGPPTGSTLASRQPDVQAAVTVLARRTVLAGDPGLDLSGSLLGGAQLGRARLAGVNLRGVDLRGAELTGADLAGTHLDQALLCGARLQGAELAGASLAGARASAETRWPAGFDWRAAGARLVTVCLP